MHDHIIGTSGDGVTITANGTYRLNFTHLGGRQNFSAAWAAEGVAPAGTVIFSFDGNPGVVPGELNLASAKNAVRANMALPFIDAEISGLPGGGRVIIYCR